MNKSCGELLSVIVPVYNEGETVCHFLQEASAFSGSIGEIIIVDDGSESVSENLENSIISCGIRVKIVSLLNNVGKDRAVLCGLSYAEYGLVGLMDADLQFHFTELLRLKDRLTEKSLDAVLALKDDYSSVWNFLFRLFARISRAKDYDRNVSDFAVIRTGLLKSCLERYQDSAVFSLKGTLPSISAKSEFVRVKITDRVSGSTKMNFTRLLEVFTSTYMLAFPNIVRLSFLFSLFFFFFAVGYSGFVVYQKLFLNTTPPGYPSLIVTELMAFSFVFFFIGILSEYLNVLVKQLIVMKPYKVIRDYRDFPGKN